MNQKSTWVSRASIASLTLFMAAFFLGIFVAQSQTINPPTFSGAPFCDGSTFNVNFNYSGISGTQNYTAELSDASGSFSSAVAIGSNNASG